MRDWVGGVIWLEHDETNFLENSKENISSN